MKHAPFVIIILTYKYNRMQYPSMDLILHNRLRSFSCERYRTMTDYLLARGSRAARKPSPTNEKLNIVKAIIKVGKSPKCQ